MQGFTILEWLLQPIDPFRAHQVSSFVAWHGRLMVLAWAVLLPLGVIIARYFKVMPGQDWPRRLDNRLWWRGHLSLQYTGGLAMLAGFALIWLSGPVNPNAVLHRWLGYAVLALGAMQFLAGWFRGSKGGPGDVQLRGDHYDMTLRRRVFEHVHKLIGYAALLLGIATVISGMWTANAPRWMWLLLTMWWLTLVLAFSLLQARGKPIGSYKAIWGPDPSHPGNRSADNQQQKA